MVNTAENSPANSTPKSDAKTQAKPAIAILLELARRARHASNQSELEFILANDTHHMVPYRQAALWLVDGATRTLSGVMQLEANAPFVRWLNRFGAAMDERLQVPTVVDKDQLPTEILQELDEWLPRHLLWLPLRVDNLPESKAEGGVLLARELPWKEQEIALLAEWVDIWQSDYFHDARKGAKGLSAWFGLSRRQAGVERKWWQRRLLWLLGVLLVIGVLPIHLNVLAPGELVAANPDVISSPLDGVIGEIHVKPNQEVKAGELLFTLDDMVIKSRLEVARQTLATAETSYRQAAQMAVFDQRAKAQLGSLMGKINEQTAQVRHLEDQLQRTLVVASRPGVALFDDPTEWIGKPVSIGQPVMRIATLEDKEIEAWLAVADGLPIPVGAPATFYLSASPLDPVSGKVRYMAYEAVQRPDGAYAYRVRAELTESTDYRVGLKGTVKIQGERASVAYWVLRRPWAVMRQYLGV